MSEFDDNRNIEVLAEALAKAHPEFGLAFWVYALESTGAGQLVIKQNPAKKLYAVLEPTQEEYKQRFRALLELADEDMCRSWYDGLFAMLPILELLNSIDKLYEGGQLTYEAQQELKRQIGLLLVRYARGCSY